MDFISKKISDEIKKYYSLHIPFYWDFIFTIIFLAEEKIEVIPFIKSSKGLSGKKFNYLDGKPELRLLKANIPAALKTRIHIYPAPMLINVTKEISRM